MVPDNRSDPMRSESLQGGSVLAEGVRSRAGFLPDQKIGAAMVQFCAPSIFLLPTREGHSGSNQLAFSQFSPTLSDGLHLSRLLHGIAACP